MTTLYLSSTYEDLKEFREAVYKALKQSGYEVVAMEDYVAADQRPLDKCLADVTNSDIYIGIFAFRYGYIPRESHGNPDKLSITELEFRHAERLRKPRLTFVVNENTLWPPKFVDAFSAEDKGDRIHRFRNYLLTERMASPFSSPHELAALVQAAVTQQIAKFNEKNKAPANTEMRPASATPPVVTWDIEKDGAPYPGLMHFTSKYTKVFFGREAEVNEILDRMRTPEGRFIIISGDSGAGKSSVIAAGVLPKLELGGLPGGENCVTVRMVPGQGNEPFSAFMTAVGSLVARAGFRPDSIIKELRRSPETLSEQIRKIVVGGTDGRQLVLFLDQMEELFSGQDADLTKRFLTALYRGSLDEKAFWVLATIRGDFLHCCYGHSEMLKLLNGRGHLALGPAEPFMIRDMIMKPAQCAGLRVPMRFVDRLVHDVGENRGGLPLLAFVLQRLFGERHAGELSESIYENFGGISGAISDHIAEVDKKIAGMFADSAVAMLAKIFQSLVLVNIDGQPTRRRVLKSNFEDVVHPIVDILIENRLLNVEGEGERSTVSIAHEKLFDAWPSLTGWVTGNRDDLLVLRHAEIEAREWVKHNYNLSYLWPSDRLQRLHEIIRRVGSEYIDTNLNAFATPQTKLIERLQDVSLSHQDRLTIGKYLGMLGDPRPGVGLTDAGVPQIDWVNIPEGEVRLKDVESPHKVRPFLISRYLVTNLQFDAFANAVDGYRNPTWWKNTNKSVRPDSSRWTEPNCPRETISWYEAVAFCCWLSELLGRKIRLPSEWEWQQAAIGGNVSNMYPWGSNWEPSYCNNYESRLNRTTAVGVYPIGATSQGVLDMVGNVLEWCLNTFENPDDLVVTTINQLDDDRAIRGGHWIHSPERLCASFRSKYGSALRDPYIGFRLVQDID